MLNGFCKLWKKEAEQVFGESLPTKKYIPGNCRERFQIQENLHKTTKALQVTHCESTKQAKKSEERFRCGLLCVLK
ncbi:hypothetical protein CAEBREN_08466 [Caenorhabditis brenneri]|uniref:Uncharacterized protein n=1 Tax=Caenorhabditis brenneri TaxID=135651 RepID=G0P7D2_CAEBE|nr:hypothetical protein CAEBREN_08466 [Caenorhabditis brenneri]